MLPYSGLWQVKIIWLKYNLAVSLSGLESNFYGGSDSTISLSSMNTNRCATVWANPIPWVKQFIIISLNARGRSSRQAPVSKHTDRMSHEASGAVLYLVAATRPAGGYVFVGSSLTDAGQQREFCHFHRNLVVFGLIAERSCHSAAA